MLEEVNFFVVLGTIIGAYVYYSGIRRTKLYSKINGEDLFFLIIGALLGGILGAKIPVWIMHWQEIISATGIERIALIIGGRTLIGALIGGFIGVEVAKKAMNIKTSTGNIFAPALAIGIGIGRIGCFVKQCCYGIETNLPWAVYMHGAYRHPTQLYEAIFHLTAFIIMWKKLNKEGQKLKPGIFFYNYILAYAIFRFLTEFIRADVIATSFGLSAGQIVCLGAIIVIGGWKLVKYIKKK